MDLPLQIALVLALSGALAVTALRSGLLTRGGSAAAFAVGSCVGACGSVEWLALLIAFTCIGFGATLLGIRGKKEAGLQEGADGERGWLNVAGVGIPACLLAAANLAFGGSEYPLLSVGFMGAMTVAAADTAASEIGVRDRRVWMVTTLKRVEPGVNGGVSVLGTAAAFAAAAAVGAIGLAVIFRGLDPLAFAAVVAAGFLGCMADSLLGATLENRGLISKYANNCVTEILGGLVAVALAAAFLR